VGAHEGRAPGQAGAPVSALVRGAQRRKSLNICLSPVALDLLAKIAASRGQTRSAVIEAWIRATTIKKEEE
jgi:hypothetical protein